MLLPSAELPDIAIQCGASEGLRYGVSQLLEGLRAWDCLTTRWLEGTQFLVQLLLFTSAI